MEKTQAQYLAWKIAHVTIEQACVDSVPREVPDGLVQEYYEELHKVAEMFSHRADKVLKTARKQQPAPREKKASK